MRREPVKNSCAMLCYAMLRGAVLALFSCCAVVVVSCRAVLCWVVLYCAVLCEESHQFGWLSKGSRSMDLPPRPDRPDQASVKGPVTE